MSNLDDPIVGIKEDFRSPERQCRESEADEAEWDKLRQDVADGKLRCARCHNPFASQGEGLFHIVYPHP